MWHDKGARNFEQGTACGRGGLHNGQNWIHASRQSLMTAVHVCISHVSYMRLTAHGNMAQAWPCLHPALLDPAGGPAKRHTLHPSNQKLALGILLQIGSINHSQHSWPASCTHCAPAIHCRQAAACNQSCAAACNSLTTVADMPATRTEVLCTAQISWCSAVSRSSSLMAMATSSLSTLRATWALMCDPSLSSSLTDDSFTRQCCRTPRAGGVRLTRAQMLLLARSHTLCEHSSSNTVCKSHSSACEPSQNSNILVCVLCEFPHSYMHIKTKCTHVVQSGFNHIEAAPA